MMLLKLSSQRGILACALILATVSRCSIDMRSREKAEDGAWREFLVVWGQMEGPRGRSGLEVEPRLERVGLGRKSCGRVAWTWPGAVRGQDPAVSAGAPRAAENTVLEEHCVRDGSL